MGSTPNYGLPTPENTDYVLDGAAAIRNLAAAIDTALKNRIATGTVTIDNPDPDGSKSATVTFPAGMFTTNPRVSLAVRGDVPTYNGKPCYATFENLSPTGMTVRVFTIAPPSSPSAGVSGNVLVHWTATR